MIINWVLGLLVLFLLVRAGRYLFKKTGYAVTVWAVIMVITLASYAVPREAAEPRMWTSANARNNRFQFFKDHYQHTIHGNTCFRIILQLHTGQDKDRKSALPLQAYTSQEGWITHQWTPSQLAVEDAGTSFQYEASGILSWQLLGITVYRQVRHFKGHVSKKSNG